MTGIICDQTISLDGIANAVLTAVGYNFRLVLRWLRALFPKILVDLLDALIPPLTPKFGS
jgi:hypothetical protein